ncbi:MAG: hypothetical protein JKY88_15765 [Pseudomonadales bacterium]|nr:hypothetical protein [Pseudomonadales bacterium]
MKFKKLLTVTVIVLFIASCASTSTKMTGTWKAPDFEAKGFKKLLVMSVAPDNVDRRMFEASMVAALTKVGVNSIASYTVLPDVGKLNEDTVTAVVEKYKYDGVLVTKLITVNTDIKRVAAKSYTQATGFYQTGYPTGYYSPGYNGFYARGYYNHYATAYTTVNEPAYNIETTTALVETNLYDVETEKLIWSGRSATVNPLSAGSVIPSITAIVAKTLKEEKIVMDNSGN